MPEPGPARSGWRSAAASLNFGDIARCRGGVASRHGPGRRSPSAWTCAAWSTPPATGAEEWVGRGWSAMTQPVARRHRRAGARAGDRRGRRAAGARRRRGGGVHPALPHRLPRPARRGPRSRRARPSSSSAAPARSARRRSSSAVAAGARVIAVAGGPEKAALCAELGATGGRPHDRGRLRRRDGARPADRGADVIFDLVGGDQTETIWTCVALGGRYLAVGFNDDPESGLTGRALRKVSMGNISVIGVMLAYLDTPRRASAGSASTPSRPRSAVAVHARAARRWSRRAGSARSIGRRISPRRGRGRARGPRRTGGPSGRTVVDLAAGCRRHACDPTIAELAARVRADRARRLRRPDVIPRGTCECLLRVDASTARRS